MSHRKRDLEAAVSPIICPNEGGRIRERGESRGIDSDSDLRPKGSNQEQIDGEQAIEENPNIEQEEPEESEIVIPESNRFPKTPSLEEYTKHQITHYPYQAWCPICVKNAAQNAPHKKIQHMRQTEIFSLDYMYMTSKPTSEELAHPILVIKARISKWVWALPVTRKGPYLSNIVQRVNNIITSVGCPKIILKSDQEPAMISLQKEIRK